MPNSEKALTYISYLKVDELLSLQLPQSDGPEGPEHDELLFIIIHQTYELWFKQIIHELGALQTALEGGDTHRSLALLGRIRTIMKTCVAQVDILETMTPLQFNSFRGRLQSSSGFQSAQFREVEAILALNDDMTVRFMQGDAAVHVDVVYKSGDKIEYKVVGRGGTDFDAYFRYMNQYCADPETRPDLAIVGTDGCCPPVRAANRLPEDVPVIFLLTSPPSSPWWQAIQRDGYGDLIHVDPQHRATAV